MKPLLSLAFNALGLRFYLGSPSAAKRLVSLSIAVAWAGLSAPARAATIGDLIAADSAELNYYAKYDLNPINPYLGRNPPITLKVLEEQMAEEQSLRQDPRALHLMMQAAFQYRMDTVAQGMSGWDALNTAIGLYHAYAKKFPLLHDSFGYWLELKNLYLTGRYYLSYDRAYITLITSHKERIGADLACYRFSHELYQPANTPREVEAFYQDCRQSQAIPFMRRQADQDYKAFVANGRKLFRDLSDRRRFKP